MNDELYCPDCGLPDVSRAHNPQCSSDKVLKICGSVGAVNLGSRTPRKWNYMEGVGGSSHNIINRSVCDNGMQIYLYMQKNKRRAV